MGQSKLNDEETQNPVQIEQNSTLIKTAPENNSENSFISQNQSLLLPDSSTPIVGSSTKKKKKSKEPKMDTTSSQDVIQTVQISNAIKIPLQKQNEASFTVMSPPQNSPDSSILFNIVSSNRKKKKKKGKKSKLDRTEKQSNSTGILLNDDTETSFMEMDHDVPIVLPDSNASFNGSSVDSSIFQQKKAQNIELKLENKKGHETGNVAKIKHQEKMKRKRIKEKLKLKPLKTNSPSANSELYSVNKKKKKKTSKILN